MNKTIRVFGAFILTGALVGATYAPSIAATPALSENPIQINYTNSSGDCGNVQGGDKDGISVASHPGFEIQGIEQHTSEQAECTLNFRIFNNGRVMKRLEINSNYMWDVGYRGDSVNFQWSGTYDGDSIGQTFNHPINNISNDGRAIRRAIQVNPGEHNVSVTMTLRMNKNSAAEDSAHSPVIGSSSTAISTTA